MAKLHFRQSRICALTVGIMLYAVTSSAAPIYHVSLDASPLNGLGTFYLEFQLIDGSPAGGDGDSLATIRNFTFTGGTLGEVLEPTFGNVFGSLVGTLTLRDGPAIFGPLADLAQAFSVMTSTSLMSFDLELTGTSVDVPTPDKFSLLILDSFTQPLPTNGPLGVEFVTAEFTTTTPMPVGFSSSAPPLTAVVSLVPGPSTLVMFGTAITTMLGVVGLPRMRRRMPWIRNSLTSRSIAS